MGGSCLLRPTEFSSPNFARAYFFILLESNTIIPVRKDGSMARRCPGVGWVLFLCACSAAAFAQEAAPQPTFEIPRGKLAAFVGQYVFDDDPDLIRSISLEGSRVFMESLRTRKVELLAESEDTFAVPNASAKFKFLRATEGKVTGFNRIDVEGNDRPSPAERSEHASKISDQPLQLNKVEYTRQEVMIPVRDGIKLHAVILRPKDYTTSLPFLMSALPMAWTGTRPSPSAPDSPNSLPAATFLFSRIFAAGTNRRALSS